MKSPAFSSPDIDLDGMWFELYTVFRFVVMTVTALAFLSALESSIETLTILFLAKWLLTCALSCWNIRGNSFEIVRLSVVHNTPCFDDILVVLLCISAANAYTVFSTCFSLCKALTIQFQAVNLSTFASLMSRLSWRQIHLFN